MHIVHTLADLEAQLDAYRHPVLVPTMGNLHEGHLALVRQAKPLGDLTVASIFVNRLCTVVLKLLACTRARTALFGKKDYQQLMVIRAMVQQFALPVRIVGGETCRAADGLALSSRNGYLDAAQRQQAVRLSQTLQTLATAIRAGQRDFAALEAAAMQSLSDAGWSPDYVVARCRVDLQPPRDAEPLVVLAAARLGTTRLIDNLEV